MKKVSRQQRLMSQFQNALAFSCFSLKNGKSFFPVKFSLYKNEEEKNLNQILVGYPHNHKYAVHRKKLLPSFQLFERHRLVSSLFPENMTSFLDIGSCKGFYCMDAAMRPGCRTATGVDIHEPFISSSKKVRDYLGIKNADFYLAELQLKTRLDTANQEMLSTQSSTRNISITYSIILILFIGLVMFANYMKTIPTLREMTNTLIEINTGSGDLTKRIPVHRTHGHCL